MNVMLQLTNKNNTNNAIGLLNIYVNILQSLTLAPEAGKRHIPTPINGTASKVKSDAL